MFSHLCVMRNWLLISLAVATVGCSSKLFESKWYTPEKSDSSFRFYDADSKIRYNIENDSSNLYFSFDVMDQLTIQKILTTGLRVFLDGTAKNKQKNEIQFPIYSDKVPISELQEYGNQYDQRMMLGKETLDQMIPADGFLKLEGKTISLFNMAENKGVLVDLQFDESRSLVYQAKIPLKYFKQESDVVSIGIETGGYDIPQPEVANPNGSVVNPNQPTAGDRAMGRGTFDQGLNGPGVGLNTPGQSTAAGVALRNSTSYNKFAEPIRFWVKVKLDSKD